MPRGRRRRRKGALSRWQVAELLLDRETKVSVARDLAREREMEAVREEQARLKAEAARRRQAGSRT